MSSHVPVIDLAPWFSGDEEARAAVAAEVDGALRSVGFFLISGHGVAGELRARVRDQARAFFALPPEAKQRYGTVTILDREPDRGGLQVWTQPDGWEDAPYQPGAFTINTGDLLARWSGGRWKSNRHRVLPPQAEAPDEDLVSLVYFYEADHDAVIESLKPPIGRPNEYAPVVSAQFIKERLDAITLG